MSVSVPGNSCRPCVTITSGCLFNLSSDCSYYPGPAIPGPGINVGDTLTVVIQKLGAFSIATTANDGLTVTSNVVKFGQTVSQAGNPAILLENREIPQGGFDIFYSGIGNTILGRTTSEGSKFQIQGSTGLNQSLLSLKLSAAYTNLTPIIVTRNSADLIVFEARNPVNGGFTSTFLGKNSGSHCTANTCTGVGEDALAAVTTGTSNTAIGFRALASVTTGLSNVAVGHASQFLMLTGGRNISLGRTSLSSSTIGIRNISIGDSSMQECGSGDNNVCIGHAAGGAMLGNQSIAIGANAMFYQNATPGLTRPSTLNVAIGFSASFTVQLGINNIVVGSNANLSGVLGNSNILLGANTDSTSSITNTTLLGTGITTGLSNIAAIGRSDQNVIIGVTNPTVDNGARLQISGNKSFGIVVSSAGTLNLDATGSGYVFSGTTATWSLPAITGKTGWEYIIKNRGSGILTINVADASTTIYGTAAVSAYTINPGEGFVFINDGTYWDVV